MKNTNLPTTPKFYLPLQKFHIVPLNDLSPKGLKTSAKQTKRDREKIPYTSLLNAVVKALGIKGGFAEYQRIYDSELLPFLRKHGMNQRTDLLKQRFKGLDTFLTDITHQNLSERLFYSEWELPEKIFTGYNFDYKHTIDDGDDYLNRDLCSGVKEGPLGLKKTRMFGLGLSVKKKCVEHNIGIARANPEATVNCPCSTKPLVNFLEYIDVNTKNESPSLQQNNSGSRYDKFANRTLVDIVVGGFIRDLDVSFHLLGDSLVKPAIRPSVVQLYSGDSDKTQLNDEKQMGLDIFGLFRERIEQGNDGWVDIIPFNDCLIFLRGADGQYDFVFKNQRNKVFEHQVFGNSLKRSDIPSCISDYQFLRWHYFEYQGWRQMDRHNSENLFYQNGGVSSEYPGEDAILRRFYESKNHFNAVKNRSGYKLPDFYEVKVCGKRMMISNLVSIEELERFKITYPDYMDYRVGDNLDSVNDEFDRALPVTLTWFDALAYINYFEQYTKVPVRLLNIDEYKSLRAPEAISQIREPVVTDLEFTDPSGNLFTGHPPYMDEDDFQKLTCRFGNIDLQNSESGLSFMKSNCFAEWLIEGTCIRSGNLKSFYNDDYLIRSRAPLNSTGKYKGVKIGFRLCYELAS
jgi:hypothetical protein